MAEGKLHKEGNQTTGGGGVTKAKDLPYCPPVGPKHQGHQSPGLPGGTNHGNAVKQGKH